MPTIARSPSSQLALLVQLRVFQAVGRFLPMEDVPASGVEYVAQKLGVECEARVVYAHATLYRHQAAQVHRTENLLFVRGAGPDAFVHVTELGPVRPVGAVVGDGGAGAGAYAAGRDIDGKRQPGSSNGDSVHRIDDPHIRERVINLDQLEGFGGFQHACRFQ